MAWFLGGLWEGEVMRAKMGRDGQRWTRGEEEDEQADVYIVGKMYAHTWYRYGYRCLPMHGTGTCEECHGSM